MTDVATEPAKKKRPNRTTREVIAELIESKRKKLAKLSDVRNAKHKAYLVAEGGYQEVLHELNKLRLSLSALVDDAPVVPVDADFEDA